MRPRPRTRKAIKWGGAAVTLLLLVAWIGSGWAWVSHHAEHSSTDFYHGSVTWDLFDSPVTSHRPGWSSGLVSGKPRFDWVPKVRWDQWSTLFILPLWIPASVSLAVTTAAWRLDAIARRRARLNRCTKCGYNRAGIAADAKCPECGAAAACIQPRQSL